MRAYPQASTIAGSPCSVKRNPASPPCTIAACPARQAYNLPPHFRSLDLATPQQLSSFLANVERRAFKHAMYAVRNEDAALDIVQDAMLKLAEKYGDRPAEELPPVFQRILQNAIHDHFRRGKVRSTWTVLLSALKGGKDDNDDDFDPLESIAAEPEAGVPVNPSDQLQQKQVMAAIEAAIAQLPARQREAFLLRYWEEFDVAETAAVMGCSEGSVKTHCSRAVAALSAALAAKGIRP
jgi:RNA polymerase sigma-70 factor (ECF subfamily)